MVGVFLFSFSLDEVMLHARGIMRLGSIKLLKILIRILKI